MKSRLFEKNKNTFEYIKQHLLPIIVQDLDSGKLLFFHMRDLLGRDIKFYNRH